MIHSFGNFQKRDKVHIVMSKRKKTNYPGVYYRDAKRIGGKGNERVYYIVFKKDGKTIEEKVGRQYADDMTPARASGIRAERIEGKRLSRKQLREHQKASHKDLRQSWTINRLWDEYQQTRTNKNSLYIDEGRFKKYLRPQVGDKQPHEIVLTDIDKLKKKLSKKLAPQTVKHILNLLGWIVNYGVKRNLCSKLPFHLEKPKVSNLKTEDLTPQQLKKLLNAIEEDTNIQVKALMKLALFTGMRRGEMFKLKWDDIDYHRGFIHICDPKGGTDQTIPMNNNARELLLSHPKNDSSPYVFPGKNGGQRVTAAKGLNKIKKRAELPKDFRPLHGLRHVYASMLASTGKVDMYTLQKLLTHKSPLMTQRYAHLRDEALKKASNLADDIVNGIDLEKDE